MKRFDFLLNSVARFVPPERARSAAPVDNEDLIDAEDLDGGDDAPEDDAADAEGDEGGDTGPEDTEGDDGDEGASARAGDEDTEDASADQSQRRRDAGQPRRQGRASEVIRTLKDERTQLKQRLDELERRFAAPPQPQQPAQLTARQEQELLATMTVDERVDYKFEKMQAALAQQTNAVVRNTAEMTDQQAFRSKLAEVPRLKKYADDVEARYQKIIREGGYVPRLGVLTYVLGERAMQRLASGDVRPGAPSGRVRRQRVAPSNARGDAASTRSSSRGKSLEDRLENVQI